MHDNDDSLLRPRVRTMQIIAGALIAGVLFFLAFALLRGPMVDGRPMGEIAGLPIMTAVAIGFLLVQIPVALVLPHLMMQGILRSIAAEQPPDGGGDADSQTVRLLGARQTVMLVALALIESVGFVACIAVLFDRHIAALIVAGICLAIMVANFPTEGRLRYWLEQQRRRLHEARHA